jgi:hypothetical protein
MASWATDSSPISLAFMNCVTQTVTYFLHPSDGNNINKYLT